MGVLGSQWDQGTNSNSERDLFRWIDLEKLARLSPYLVHLPRELKRKQIPLLEPTPMMLPHELLHSVFLFEEMQWVISMMDADMQHGSRL